MKHFDKIKLFSMVCFVVFSLFALSCKQDQRMPQLNTSKQSDSYDENTPKTTVGIDEVVKFNFSENEVRAISMDQTQGMDGKGKPYQKPQLKWNIGDRYRFYATVRYVDTKDPNNWKPNFSDNGMWIEVTKVNPDGRSGEFRIRGEMQINDSYIKDARTKNPSLQPFPDNWYIGGFIGGKLGPTGTMITDDLGVEPIYEYPNNKGIKGIRMKEKKFVAVDPDAKTFDMNVPLGVPLSKVILKDYGTKIYVHIPENTQLQLRPLGTVFCVQVKNGLVHSVAIPKGNSSVKIKSRFLTKNRLQFDLWHHQSELSKVGTPNFSIHHVYDGNYNPEPDEWGRTEASVSIDWSQYPKTKSLGNDAVLDMDDCVNLYLWSVWNDSFGGQSGFENFIELDFSGLNLKTPTYVDGFNGFQPMNSAKVTYYGGADKNTRGVWQNRYDNKTVDFLSTNVNTSRTNINKGSTVFSRFTIQSELFISEVYFDWRENKGNNGIIEIFNPNSTAVDLSDYYLMRMDYSKNVCNFVGPFGTRTDRFQCGLLMPLNLSDDVEFTPGTSDKNKIVYHNIYSGEADDKGNPYRSDALLYVPHDKSEYTKLTHLEKGLTMCIAGHGAYKLIVDNKNNRNPDLKRGLFADGMLADEKVFTAIKSYLVPDYEGKPQIMGFMWGVVDGNLEKNALASANDPESGVIARDANQGWALVKRIENKYYIIDSFGPTWLTPSGGGITAQGFRELMDNYKKSYPVNNFDMIRKDNIVFPNGGMVGPSIGDEWNMKQNPEYEVSIGARSRYTKSTKRGNTIPYFYGGR